MAPRNLIAYLVVAYGVYKFLGINHNMSSKREERRKAAIEKQIDENLRRTYEQDSAQDIPDRFLQLLAKLREQE